ncbi:glutamate--cysteine ligase [Streptomyces sp. ISL-66]|uniref:carboxylate-amine ligase n=1 Tax=Streptomyces sp. ISL-66 TaxID=2819186 RepID=UPI001BED154A|nr:glutamate--cysteine ligase [Streptomyces sp. ISL-66]MBT2471512.1 glutamate--cysteine ligase [Streptomyces sp. ISL-66]
MSTALSAAADRGAPGPAARKPSRSGRPCEPGRALLTMGVEEEFLLVDRLTRAPAGRAPQVIAATSGALGPQVQHEFFTAQVEVCTRPTSDSSRLRAELAWLRDNVSRAASDEGCLLVASGTPVIPPEGPLEVTAEPRYARMVDRYARVLGDLRQVVCGCHIHIGVPDRGRALDLANRMRPWLPVLQALAANSPFDRGTDSGYASWRSVAHARWPGVGPAPVLDEDGYERTVETLVRTGHLLDRRMVYWYARPSEHVPTLEIRVADVNADLDVVVLLAALVRGLAASLVSEAEAGVPPPVVGSRALRTAHHLAALHGLEGDGLDVGSGRRVPAWDLVGALLERAAPGLDAAGDLPMAATVLGRLRLGGGGACRQRAAHRRAGSLYDVVDTLAATTSAQEG